MKHICENCLTIIYKSKVTPTVCPHCESGKMFDIGDSIADHILNLESKLDRLQQASRWIPVAERKPTVDDCRRDSEGNLIPFVMGCINGTLYGLIHIHHFALNDYYTDWQPIQLLPIPPEGE